jgi:S-adenosylmethionine:tRNA ribosyltransferase-isomerase
MDKTLRLSDFDYELPRELIAQHPTQVRDESRLLVLNRRTGAIEHRNFFNIVEYLNKGDVLVLNDTKVIPVRIIGRRKTGARVEALLCGSAVTPPLQGLPQRQTDGNNWYAMLNTNARLKVGEQIIFENGAIIGTLLNRPDPKQWIIDFEPEENFMAVLNRVGRMPLPPYIKRTSGETCNETILKEDRERYQTVFARWEGAIAAPTASLHFTSSLLEKIKAAGIELVFVLLHVGPGTFLPIESEDVEKHVMQKEYYEISKDAAHAIRQAKDDGRRVVAVGSTSCRALETIAKNSIIQASSGWTDLFIYPPYKFKTVDALITNFHLPKTTLLLMVSAFAGRKEILTAYETAKKEGYRFYSYGDAMLII